MLVKRNLYNRWLMSRKGVKAIVHESNITELRLRKQLREKDQTITKLWGMAKKTGGTKRITKAKYTQITDWLDRPENITKTQWLTSHGSKQFMWITEPPVEEQIEYYEKFKLLFDIEQSEIRRKK